MNHCGQSLGASHKINSSIFLLVHQSGIKTNREKGVLAGLFGTVFFMQLAKFLNVGKIFQP
jgi:hypothetical protein